MQLYRVFLMTVISLLGYSSATSSGIFDHPLNGWYPCHKFTFSESGGSSSQGGDAECAIYTAPLCYPGICEISEFAEPTVDIFVKRIPATAADTKTAHNVWLVQGGPGYSSTSLESSMMELHAKLAGAVNVYTMDHRGTGRSTLFDCVAAQTTMTGSTLGREIDPSEVPACAKDLRMKYGDLASFSTTSAATDISAFISKFSNGASSIVYGVSYGTVVVERLMHLSPPTVNGYVLDGIATTSGASGNKFQYYSMWDADFGKVGDYFMELCAQDITCSSHFQSANLSVALQDLMTRLDNNPNSTCATLLSNSTDTLPSHALRQRLAVLLKDTTARTIIPPIVYRLSRCDTNDVDAMTHFFAGIDSFFSSTSQDDPFQSTLLYYLIIFSDMWETPTPSTSEMESRFTNASITDGMYSLNSLYCAFSKEKSPACKELNLANYEGEGIIYQRDQYWNKRAIVSTQASVLLLSGKLDPQTPHKYAEYLFDALDCQKKELITFDYAAHVATVSTPFGADINGTSLNCGMELLVSYVKNNGDLQRMDRSCIDEMPPFNLTVPIEYVQGFFSTDEVYDGVYNASFSQTEESA
ncbi:hypothetical protein PPTG_18011 [Phytophthora nicotianae INRA-310]|uniref:Peptidase S33 tripeptidyl aminopeptidase-like C-terminal domain-containing protein n=2 Tax=Phytophthora nicotianae TaxID=4792 RepID=W2PJU7_PHYN3|nr:hypothetical protein PPTG_18011 [Phytophthora nicotianae INRA-310]ETN00300.1 hypothetical protein PPTG_18011 [Phytophthora nicotianae INRA-310]